ncbi:MAG: DUF1972 domain-containing protein [Limnohabitans sp.]|uniref:DUF1972 domain-containing protein n=1 Tax=Flavobacterium sp. TaxID=239 RepID=UPI003D109B48|nr:DUF1972 domain-containing protein [Limnohabitans sp.]
MKTKKIAIIGTVGLPAKYGGFETLTSHLVKQLSSTYDFTVYCSGKKYKKEERLSSFEGAKLEYINLEANGIQSIPYDTLSILKAIRNNDILLVLGVAGAWIFPLIRLFTNKKIIVSIDGIEWKRDKWSLPAKLYLWWAEKIAVKFSHIDISDNESIQDYTAMRYKTLSRVVEYGANHTVSVSPNEKDFEKYPFLQNEYAVKVCRIEPENNVHLVLEAFKKHTSKTLVIVGNWENSPYGKKLRETYNSCANIYLLDPIYNQREIDLIRGNAHLYIHGHSAGGTNPSLVEAMYLGLPVISYNVSYNKTTTEGKAIYFDTTEDLVAILEKMNPEVAHQLKLTMKSIANRRYTWELIAKKYEQLFEEAMTVNSKKRIFSDLQTRTTLLEEYKIAHLSNSHVFYEKS